MIPDPGLSSGLYLPLAFGALLYALLLIGGAALERRGSPAAEDARNLAFGCVLGAGAYTAVLAVIAVVSKATVIADFVYITVVVVAFFALLGAVLLVFELLVGSVSRRRRRRVKS